MFADLARRGLAHPATASFVKRAVQGGNGKGHEVEVPEWGVALMAIAFWAAMISVYLLSYMLHEVVATLCMVESPVAAITISPSSHDNDVEKEEKEGLLESNASPSITLVNAKPITSSIRGTIRHIVSHAGRTARIRGLPIYFFYTLAFSLQSLLISAILPNVPGKPVLVAAASGALMSRFHAIWTHKVISMPSSKSFMQRQPPLRAFKVLALPAAIEAAMPYVSMYLTCGFAMLLQLHRVGQHGEVQLDKYTTGNWVSLGLRVASLFIFALVCTVFLCVPAVVTLVRIEASILPEDEDTIVPFDRSFGGKLTPTSMGGSGRISFLDAWRSFNWEARRRLIKTFVKIAVVLTGYIFVLVHVLVALMFIIMRSAMGEFLNQLFAGPAMVLYVLSN